MPSIRTLSHFPEFMLDWIELVGVENKEIRVPCDKSQFPSQRGKFYQFVGALKREARGIEALQKLDKDHRLDTREEYITHLAHASSKVMCTWDSRNNCLLLLNHEKSWWAQAFAKAQISDGEPSPQANAAPYIDRTEQAALESAAEVARRLKALESTQSDATRLYGAKPRAPGLPDGSKFLMSSSTEGPPKPKEGDTK